MLVPVEFPAVRFNSANTGSQWGEKEDVCFQGQLSSAEQACPRCPLHSETGLGLHKT